MSRKKVVDVKSILHDDYEYVLSCKGKKCYESEYQAKYTADVQYESGKTNVRLHWYKCKFCGMYHLSHRT